jgi:hypothetical protein
MKRPGCIDIAHAFTFLSFLVFGILAIVSIVISQNVFEDRCRETGDTILCPILFCGFASPEATIQAAVDGSVECFDKQLIGMLVPTSAVLSIVAIVIHVMFLGLARCRNGACGMSHAFNDGVVAGMSVTLVFLLFVTALVFVSVAIVAQYFDDQYSTVNEINGRLVQVELDGNTNVLFAAAAFCFLSCLLAIMESIVLCRRELRTPAEPVEAKPAEEGQTDLEAGAVADDKKPAETAAGPSAADNPFKGKDEPAATAAPAPAADAKADNPFKGNAHLQNK